MKFKAEITNKDVFEDLLRVQVRFTSEDGSVIIQDAYESKTPNTTWLQDKITNKIKQLEDFFIYIESIKLGVFENKSIEPTEVTIFIENYNKYLKLKNLAALNIIADDNKDLIALQKTLATTYNAEYLNII